MARDACEELRGSAFDPEHTPDVRSARITMERAETESRRYGRVVESGAVSGMLHDQKRASWLGAKERYEAEVARAAAGRARRRAQPARRRAGHGAPVCGAGRRVDRGRRGRGSAAMNALPVTTDVPRRGRAQVTKVIWGS
ncbi:MAG TPA: hypothetical protein VFD82_08780 [Planctomycetota bacterium]|nr:hypothetical protein [Planctomycetota bacterium]